MNLYVPNEFDASVQSSALSRRPINTSDAKLFLRSIGKPHVFQTFSDSERTKVTQIVCISGKPGDPDAKIKRKKFDPLAKVLTAPHQNWEAELAHLNDRGSGVFFTAQQTDGNGRERKNFRRVRVIAIDLDNGLPDNRWPVEPSLVVESSPGKWQVYWLLADGETISPDTFKGIMGRLVADWKADHRATDLMRALRIPGYWHQKHEPFQVKFVNAADVREHGCLVYTAEELEKAFPPLSLPRREKAHPKTNYPAADIRTVRSALMRIASKPSWANAELTVATDYETWWQVGLALFRTFGENGLELFHEFSKQSPHYDASGVDEKWNSFANAADRDDGITVGTIFHVAKQHGWSALSVRFRNVVGERIAALQRLSA